MIVNAVRYVLAVTVAVAVCGLRDCVPTRGDKALYMLLCVFVGNKAVFGKILIFVNAVNAAEFVRNRRLYGALYCGSIFVNDIS